MTRRRLGVTITVHDGEIERGLNRAGELAAEAAITLLAALRIAEPDDAKRENVAKAQEYVGEVLADYLPAPTENVPATD